MADDPTPLRPTDPDAPEGHGDGAGTSEDVDAAARALSKLRGFIESLPDDERTVLAALLAPGVASAYTGPAISDDDEVVGFGMTTWTPERLPETLAARIRDERFRIEQD